MPGVDRRCRPTPTGTAVRQVRLRRLFIYFMGVRLASHWTQRSPRQGLAMPLRRGQTLFDAVCGAARTARAGPHSAAHCLRRPLSSGHSGPSGSRNSSAGTRQLRLDWALLALGVAAGTTATIAWTSWGRRAQLESLALLGRSDNADDGRVVRSGGTKGPPRLITAQELSQHSNGTSLWVAIDGEVWDVTDFYMRHPGGPQILVDHGGQDVTQVFRGIHARGILEKTLSRDRVVGRLEEQARVETLESKRIREAREGLFGVDSIVNLDDFEVGPLARVELEGCKADFGRNTPRTSVLTRHGTTSRAEQARAPPYRTTAMRTSGSSSGPE